MSKRRRDRRRFWKRRIAQTYAPPGTLTSNPYSTKPLIRVMAYGPDSFVEETLEKPEDALKFVNKWPVVWINVDGLGDAGVLAQLGEIFGLHRLALEDILNVDQRAKVEQYDDKLFIVARMSTWTDKLETEQFSIFLGPGFVLTFQETFGDCLDSIRERIRRKGGRIRDHGPDYLAYALLDAIVDAYFPILERYGERLEQIEDETIERPNRGVVAKIQQTKRELLTLRRAMWPLREAVNQLMRETHPLITADTKIYLRDCYDHVIQILDLTELYRELESGLMEIYLSSVSFRLNEVMKVLTVITTIFVPLTFIASIYGMNFEYLPEKHWKWGYPAVLLFMAAVAAALIIFFYRKGWLSALDARKKSLEAEPDLSEKERTPSNPAA